MSTTHTPGPWKVEKPYMVGKEIHYTVSTNYPEALCNGSRSICTMTGFGCKDRDVDSQNEANAALIARAPEMAEEIERLKKLVLKLGQIAIDNKNPHQFKMMGGIIGELIVECGYTESALREAK